MTKIDHRKLRFSFYCAFKGIWKLLLTEQNARIHFVFAILVMILAYVVDIPKAEFIILLIMVTLVFLAEIINTAIEKLLDRLHPRSHETIEIIKDAMAGAVLIAAVSAVIIGLLIFVPHILRMIYY